ncbi:hypothetical protein EV127DRAFT_423819 [Xylaria flabelliformis]|nr:hypothetical protein EV127DRAFT_423819 [Xylaria flabelliformis]
MAAVPTFIAALIILGLGWITVALRFYTRIFARQGLKWDDWLLLLAAITGTTVIALTVSAAVVAPDGNDTTQIFDPNYTETPEDIFYLKINLVTAVIYYTINASVKLSILYMYYRIFHAKSSLRYQLFVTAGLVIGWWIGTTVAQTVNCIPISKYWTSNILDPKYCFNLNTFFVVGGSIEVFLDVLILTLPIRAVLALKLSWRRKAIISGIFLLGSFVIATGLVRVIVGYAPGSQRPSSSAELWTVVHSGVGVICASLPIFNPLLQRILKSSFVTHTIKFFSRSSSDQEEIMRRERSEQTIIPLETMSDTVYSTQDNIEQSPRLPKPTHNSQGDKAALLDLRNEEVYWRVSR